MRVLVIGGSGSGKSAYAERLACELSPVRTYLATMEAHSPEAKTRIARHRAQREGLRFATIECQDELPKTPPPSAPMGVALLEDVGNLVANTLFNSDGSINETEGLLHTLQKDIMDLSHCYEHLVVVGNEVGAEGTLYDEATFAWIRLVGALCCRLAAQFDVVVEVVAGLPYVVKGSLA